MTDQEYETRIMRQTTRYGRTYRAGIHDQIQAMKTRHRKYRAFVNSIEKTLSENPTIKFTEKAHNKVITIQESSIKLTLKADLLRESIPEKFTPKDTSSLTKAFNAQIPTAHAVTPNTNQPIPQSRERKDWFIPASERMRGLHDSIERELAARGHIVQADDNIKPDKTNKNSVFNYSTGKRTTYESVREKTRQEAQTKREDIPPQYRQEPYEPETPKTSRMSGAFNRASADSTQTPPHNHNPNHQPQ